MKTFLTFFAALWAVCALGGDFPVTAPKTLSYPLPDGNYMLTVTLGSKRRAASTTVRCESRRLLCENVVTRKGQITALSFLVNKHSPVISTAERVKIKKREETKLNWDDVLTVEITGDSPSVIDIRIVPDSVRPTIYLCGNSTVVDQDEEPWASWGQMLPRFLNENIAVANYAESGETASTFCSALRFKRILKDLRAGDWVFMEFGHNDQKQRFPGAGAYYNFTHTLKTMIDEVRQRGATPVLVSPTQRRSFKDGRIQETHADYPEAMEVLARREGVTFIDLHAYTRTLYEAWGEEASKRAFVHYPANTYPGQTKALADNTHFNPYGAYEICKCVLHGLKEQGLLTQYMRDFTDFDPAHPDPVESFHWTESDHIDIVKPDGN